jgi:hypothetical protein
MQGGHDAALAHNVGGPDEAGTGGREAKNESSRTAGILDHDEVREA